MSDDSDLFGEQKSMEDVREFQQSLADDRGKNLDPLADAQDALKKIETREEINCLAIFYQSKLTDSEVSGGSPVAERTKESYRTLIRQWREHMGHEGRHAACPNVDHVMSFAEFLQDKKGNQDGTKEQKLQKLNSIFKFWQDDPAFPHDTDFNPVSKVLSENTFRNTSSNPPHEISLTELRGIIGDIHHQRDLAIIACLFKLGIRATALSNVELQDISLPHPDINDEYPELGSNPHVADYEAAIYIPHDREGNKAKNPRVLPLDDELRRIITDWLLVRWDNGESHLFLGKDLHEPMEREGINNTMKEYFPDSYLQDTERYSKISSKYGRHRFCTHWKVHDDISDQKILYMRGDAKAGRHFNSTDAITEYLHTYYDDIREPYLNRIFKFGI